MSGNNPYDSFRGRLAILPSKWDQGGVVRFTEMAKYTSNELGLTNFTTYDKSLDTTFEKVMKAPLLERMFEVTDYGITEKELFKEAQGKQDKTKSMNKLIKDYFAEPSDKKLMETQSAYVIGEMGTAPEGGWKDVKKAEETRLKSEFKRNILSKSGNGEYVSIAKSGISNDDKAKIIDTISKRLDTNGFHDWLVQVVKYGVVSPELYAEVATSKNIPSSTTYNVAKSAIPFLSADQNNTLLTELRRADLLSNDDLTKLRNDGLLTLTGYTKYIAINKTKYLVEKAIQDKKNALKAIQPKIGNF
jgi:hypothetical protein